MLTSDDVGVVVELRLLREELGVFGCISSGWPLVELDRSAQRVLGESILPSRGDPCRTLRLLLPLPLLLPATAVEHPGLPSSNTCCREGE